MNKQTLISLVVVLLLGAFYMKTRPNLNVRNNNPLNIRFSEANNWDGQTGKNGGFSVFESPAFGFRAAYKLVKRYIDVYELTSINDIVSRWAPPEDDNHTEAYIEYLADKLGKYTFTPVYESELPDLLFYMAEYEGAKGAFTLDEVRQGIALA
jgi:hypothetical protein